MATSTLEDEAEEEALVTLFADVNAVTYRALSALADFDEKNAYGTLSYQSCSQWLNVRVGMSPVTAREHLRVARALKTLPKISACFAKGSLSYSKVRALTRLCDEKSEEVLLTMAQEISASQLDKILRSTRKVLRSDAKAQLESRTVQMGFDDDGMFYMKVRLMADEGSRILGLIEAEARQLKDGIDKPELENRSSGEWMADGLLSLLAPAESRTTEVVLHVDAGGAQKQLESPRGDRISVSAESAERMMCDASTVVMTHGEDGSVLDVGRKSRKITAALKRALSERDRGCRPPHQTLVTRRRDEPEEHDLRLLLAPRAPARRSLQHRTRWRVAALPQSSRRRDALLNENPRHHHRATAR
jgi:Domain of unknown function (DUF222)